ncbi:protein pitchfork-like [Scyliorhinus canicula]|uniref:protein pitchfork-like n=1 Tax=Scyliorhinus canicula TaxID=7830 RepID=UPI0018F52B98|nr:protein pitchfork-like [Scyliorhinus canicula]
MAQKRTVKKKNLPTNIPDRKLFPLHWAPDRLGNEFPPIKGTPNRGPGRYETYLTGSLTDNLEKKHESKIGYALGARTAIRFMPQLSESPGPAGYQRKFGKDQILKPSSAPFGSTTPRGRWSPSNKLVVPGPGTYEPNKQRNRQVEWPMKFGAPDWNLIPAPKRRTLRIELASDKEFRKHRNRVAYFRLYFP